MRVIHPLTNLDKLVVTPSTAFGTHGSCALTPAVLIAALARSGVPATIAAMAFPTKDMLALPWPGFRHRLGGDRRHRHRRLCCRSRRWPLARRCPHRRGGRR
jgi:hypothetical protein